MDDFTAIIDQLGGSLGLSAMELVLAAVAVTFVIIIILGLLIGYWNVLSLIAYFAYPVARVKAIGNPLVDPQKVGQLVESKNLYDLATKLKNFGHPVDLHGEEPRMVEGLLMAFYYADYLKLEDSVPDSIKPFIKAYRCILESEQLKAAIRMKYAGIPLDVIRQELTAIGIMTPALIEKMSGAPTLDEMILSLRQTEYGKPLSEALAAYKENHTPLPLERALDTYVFQNLNASRLRIGSSISGPVNRFIGAYIDIANIKTLIRAKNDGLTTDQVARYLISGGYRFPEWRLRQIYEYPNVPEMLSQFSGSEYYTSISKAMPLYEENGSIVPFELELDRQLLSIASTLAQVYHLSGGPLIKFMVARMFEMRNARLVFHGILRGIPGDDLKTYAICEGTMQ